MMVTLGLPAGRGVVDVVVVEDAVSFTAVEPVVVGLGVTGEVIRSEVVDVGRLVLLASVVVVVVVLGGAWKEDKGKDADETRGFRALSWKP